MTNTVTKYAATEKELLALGEQLAKLLPSQAIIFLYGPLGAGKTTFTRGILRGLNYQGKVKSPTYTLVEPYEIKQQKVFHFDFFRLQDASELKSIGIHDYFNEPAICLIEWPENGFPFLPKPDLACYISPASEGRELRFIAHTPSFVDIIKHL